MFLKETTTLQYGADTLDPVAHNTHLRTDNYHYQVCLQQRYTKQCRPEYLTPEGFETLKKNGGENMDCFRLHTDSIINVLKGLGPDSLTVWVGMDQ